MFLWPSNRITWRMSLVLWYSMVAFQWRKVCARATRNLIVMVVKSLIRFAQMRPQNIMMNKVPVFKPCMLPVFS